LQICKDNNLPINVFEERNPSLLHGKVGAFMAKNKYGITDEEILSAITWHTTGKDNMTDLEKIVFCADYIEPGRTKQPHLEELRSIALSDLDMLTFRILEDTVEYLKAKSLDCIDDNTITAYNFYKKLIEER
jgi:nicotinate-nucleotide adenylyltransferase